MAQSNIDIKIIAEFLGKNAFKQADTAATKLNKSVKSLGQSFGLAFGGAALGYAIKSTIRDFADAQRETQQLTNTVKNLGLAFAAPEIDAYVQKIGKLYGVTGDQAVPAMQSLLTATGSVSRSTNIMNVALDLAASRNADVASVAKDLSSAYVGNTKGLNQYKLGLTKAELAAMTFDEILEKIGSQTLGAADEAAKTLTGQLAILAEVSNQAKERIGGGLVEVLGGLAGPDGAGGAAKNIENLSIKLTNAITGFGYLVQEVKIATPILAAAGVAIGLAWAPWLTGIAAAALAIGAIGNAMKKDMPKTPLATGNLFNQGKLFFPTGGDAGYSERLKAQAKAEKEALARAKALAKLVKDQAANQAKILKDKKLQNAIDKANLALNKGTDVFDMDKIQNAAALTNQAEQLGKATTGSQLLQIANDTARLNVKKSILALEDAIASKDEAAIASATTKLNADLKILNTLTGQSLQMASIQSILAGLVPKDLVNQKNLDDALAKIREMLALLGKVAVPDLTTGGKAGGTSGGKAGGTSGGLSGGKSAAQLAQEEALADFFKKKLAEEAAAAAAALAAAGRGIDEEGITGQVIEHIAAGSDIDAILEYADAATARANAIASLLEGNNAAGMAALTTNALANAAYGFQSFQTAEAASFLPTGNGSVGGGIGAFDRDINITVNTGVGDPNAIAEAIENLLREANSRGTLTSGILGIA